MSYFNLGDSDDLRSKLRVRSTYINFVNIFILVAMLETYLTLITFLEQVKSREKVICNNKFNRRLNLVEDVFVDI